jgi:hypothetical protein
LSGGVHECVATAISPNTDGFVANNRPQPVAESATIGLIIEAADSLEYTHENCLAEVLSVGMIEPAPVQIGKYQWAIQFDEFPPGRAILCIRQAHD